MKHLIMGTAGHVDHGKTALIKALTGIECDTHKEEKERGITIHLGFASLPMPDDGKIGIIDVPGHRDFIHTMVSGAAGIDFVLLVIAADSSVMPQTIEHLQIMEILGIKKGIVLLTKSDLVDDELLELCEIDVIDLLSNSFLKDSPIIKVSAKTGQGIAELKDTIQKIYSASESRSPEGIFRMYIDRIFSKSGFGTIVTGTVIGGKIEKENNVFLLSQNPRELRVRRMERHGEEVHAVQAGDRASINLVGLEKAEFSRGLIISDRILKNALIADAKLNVYAKKCELGIWSKVIFHTGTYEHQVKIHLINKNRITTGESALVQIHFETPIYLQHGDKFVIRNSSCDLTIGGGEIIDAAPLHHRRRPEKLINELELVAKNKLSELISLEVRKSLKPMMVREIAEKLNISIDSILRLVDSRILRGIVRYDTKDSPVLVSQICLENIRNGILTAVKDFRKRNPLSEKGINIDEIRSTLKLEKKSSSDEILLAILNGLVEKEKLRESSKTWFAADDTGKVDPKTAKNVRVMENYFLECGMQTPLSSQIQSLADKENIAEKELKAILHHFVSSGKIIKIEDSYVHSSVVSACRNKLIEKLSGQKEGIKVSDFRDLVNGNRKISLLLLAHFDAEGLTRRDGDFRFLKTNINKPKQEE
ncbi:MAG: selenocysteine-specific translation elongation factor [Candidatus Riflebacteria bacterium]|nr:selenocysteine-specific translation elongation factor [Candidatus Riflebacteria bacterium]